MLQETIKLNELRIKIREAEAERDKRTQYLESPEDLDLLIEREDLVRFGTWSEMVYFRRDDQNLTLLGVTCNGLGGDGGAFIRIPLSDLEIVQGNIVDKGYAPEYFDLNEYLSEKMTLEKTGVLY